MALARFTILISLLLYNQGSHGQQSSSINGATIGPNSLNPAIPSNEGKAEHLIQNQNANGAKTLNAQIPVNFQSLFPTSTISTQSTLALQQPQSYSQPLNLQLSQVPNFQQAVTVQPSIQLDAAFSQNSANLQQSKSSQNPQTIYKIPVIQQIPSTNQLNSQQSINLGDLNIRQQIPIQSSQGISIPTAFSSFPAASITPNCPCKRTDVINDLGTNYLQSTANAYSVIETPQSSPSYSSLPVYAVLSTPTPIPLVTHTVMPYGNQVPDVLESPLRISNNFYVEEEENQLNQDKFTSLLLSMLQSKKSSKSGPALETAVNPYQTSHLSQGSSSTMKSLLPLILDLINERRANCDCCCNCQECEQRRKCKKDTELQMFGGYSKRADNSLREAIFQNDGSAEDTTRIIREQKKLKNPIPMESCEYDDDDDDCSDEED